MISSHHFNPHCLKIAHASSRCSLPHHKNIKPFYLIIEGISIFIICYNDQPSDFSNSF